MNPSNPEIDPGSQDGQLTTARDETEESCLSGGPGWKHYEKRDATNGDRAVGITACLTSESIKGGTGTDKNIRLPGYQWAQKEAWKTGRKSWDAINNCHLLGKGLGGSGTDLDNLSTCSREANADSMDNSPNLARNMDYYEDLARKAVTIDKQAVYYTVTPKYAGGRTVPYGYQMTARGVNRDGSPGLKFDDIVYNEMYDRKRKWAFNLGYRLDGDLKPVPVGGTP
ncbi:DNA/RNA non-specific endonuclease [Embleya sp. NPDC005575]|uniref:DNA/RNA non-specific endonuclease n=1 Tax=Embleya sp. NPDC005575 TaxID=3156892 RepID=UPI0033B5D6A2